MNLVFCARVPRLSYLHPTFYLHIFIGEIKALSMESHMILSFMLSAGAKSPIQASHMEEMHSVYWPTFPTQKGYLLGILTATASDKYTHKC